MATASFKDFLSSQNFGSTTEMDNSTRIFLWSLINGVHDRHCMDTCPKRVGPTTITVRCGRGFVDSKDVAFSPRMAKRNYKGIEDLIRRYFPLNYGLTKLLALLEDDPLGNAYLICRHFSILPDAIRIALITRLVNLPYSLSKGPIEEYENAISRVSVNRKWNELLVDRYLQGVYDRWFYKNNSPLELLRFHRDTMDHVGVKNRPIINTESKVYRGWEDGLDPSERPSCKKRCLTLSSTYPEEPTAKVGVVLDALVSSFPTFLVDVEERLYQSALLKYLCVNPHDRMYTR